MMNYENVNHKKVLILFVALKCILFLNNQSVYGKILRQFLIDCHMNTSDSLGFVGFDSQFYF